MSDAPQLRPLDEDPDKKTKNLTFMEAIKAAKEGKVIMHHGYKAIWRNGSLIWVHNEMQIPITDMTLDCNWEIVEEKKTLSDKEIDMTVTKLNKFCFFEAE